MLYILTDRNHPALINDDSEFLGQLDLQGVEYKISCWENTSPQAEHSYLFRTTWNYIENPVEFKGFLSHLKNSGARVYNPIDFVLWNWNKRYLLELQHKGLPVVPTHVESHFNPQKLVVESPLVVKPLIGASGKDTFLISSEKQIPLAEPLRDREVLIQPYVDSISSQGEFSFVFFNGQFSHCVQKRPKSGNFKVQEEHGGNTQPYQPTPMEIQVATGFIKDLPTLYARVDMVWWNSGLHLMELELIEPELFFRFAPQAAELFAKALATALNS